MMPLATDADTLLAVRRAIRDRRSVRVFSDEPVPRSLIEEILREAVWAPSPHNSQPWRFTVLFSQEDKARLAGRMAQRLREELAADALAPEVIERQTARSQARIVAAPVVILVSLHGDGLVPYADERRTSLEWEMAVQSVGAVLQTVFLLAWAVGLGSCWMAAPMYCPDDVREALRLPPSFAPQALALLGYPAHPGRVRERREMAEVVDIR